MFVTMLQSLTAARYPRRYIGRHRMRFTIRFVSSAARAVPPAGDHGPV